MDKVLLVVGAVAVAGLLVALLGRRTAPPAANTHHVPRHLDRADFARPDARWLVVVFTSTTCNTCAGVWERAALLESSEVAVQEAEADRDRRLHERYRIDAVPTLVLADRSGEVRRAFLGPMTATDLWAAVAEVREPGSVPPACDHGDVDDD
jgi:hypothetical protein